MKYFGLLLLQALCLIMCSCDKNEEPELEIALPISDTYLPASLGFNVSSMDDVRKRELIHLVHNEHIINDIAELPDDPIGFSEAYQKINFKEYTLLIKYLLHYYTIDTYSNRFYRNTKENSYNWTVSIGTASDTDIDTDEIWFTRFAILVRKIPADAQIRTWLGLTFLGNNLKTSD